MKSELLRFWRPAVGFSVALLLLLRGASAFGDLFAASIPKILVGLLVTALGGLIFGLVQVGSYRKINQWAYLIHRPLAPGKILLALAGAAAVLLAIAFALPLLLATIFADTMTSQWVDLRHYYLTPFVFGTAFSFYLVGCFIRLSPSRASLLLLALPAFFLTRQAAGLWVFLPMAVVLTWLGVLVYEAFKPDLSTHLERPFAVAASALAVQYALFLVIVGGSTLVYQTGIIFVEEGWKGYATHAWNDHFEEGTFLDTYYMSAKDALGHGLRGAEKERGRHLQREIQLAEVSMVWPGFTKFPARHQPMFMDGALSFRDEKNDVLWTFSHDRMLFFGQNATSGAAAGWLGVSGPLAEGDGAAADPSQRFQAVPYVVGSTLLTHRQLYEWAPDLQRVTLRFEVPEGESFVDSLQDHGSFLTVLTDRALYFFEPRDLEREPGLLTPMAQVELPGAVKNLESIQVAELIDGTVLSFLLGSQSERDFHEARQVVAELGASGGYEVVADLPLAQGWPSWFRHRGFIASPVLQTFKDLTWGAIAPSARNQVTLEDLAGRPLPLSVIGLALLVALFSAMSTAWACRGRELSRTRRRAWVAAAFLLGLPAFLSFLLLTARSERAPVARRSKLGLRLPLGRTA